MNTDRSAAHITIALDFCSFGAFGDLAESERQATLIKSLAQKAQAREGSLRIVVNSPMARKWQLEQFFSAPQWESNCERWKKLNIRRFAKSKRAQVAFKPDAIKRILEGTVTRVDWIDLRLAFEKCVEDDFQKSNAIITRYPGIVPFHAWLCDSREGPHYGVFALCHHQTAATAELMFGIEGDGARHLMQLTDRLLAAEKPDDNILDRSWERLQIKGI